MQKITLDEQTLGTVIDRLQKATFGFYVFEDNNNVKPLKCKSWNFRMPKEVTVCADVTVHYYFKNPRCSPFEKDRNTLGFPLIHFAFNAEQAMVFSLGDKFYFKGSTIIINHVHGVHVDVMKCNNIVSKIISGKKIKDLTLDEVHEIALRKDEAIESVCAWDRMNEEDLMDYYDDPFTNDDLLDFEEMEMGEMSHQNNKVTDDGLLSLGEMIMPEAIL